tara:strand:+ start:367 stop:579 length:213 start_codon:yes stop_codon:yes gene_type:complete
MEDLVDLIATDASSSEVSDRLKDILYAKSAERIEALKPVVANSVFDEPTAEVEVAPDEQTIEEPTEQEEE